VVALISLLGSLVFILSSLVLGTWLLRLARRTRQLPELLLGTSYFFGGFLGSCLTFYLYSPLKPQEPTLSLLWFVLRSTVAVSCGLLIAMAWKVFRAGEAWAKALFYVALAGLVSYAFQDALMTGKFMGSLPPVAEQLRHPGHWTGFVSVSLPYFWLAWESFNYQAMLRRRWRIGLPADLVVAARMRLWATAMGSQALMFVLVEIVRVVGALTGRPIFPGLLISVLGCICAVCLWLAFFMPQSQVRRIQAQAAALAPPVAEPVKTA
jgi:hypothetical protein